MSEIVASGLITFREALEASIILALVTATYKKLGVTGYMKPIVLGTLGSLAIGVALAYTILYLYGEFSQKALFEGVLSIVAAIILTSVIYWMARNGKRLAEDIRNKAMHSLSFTSILALITVIVGREAVETVILVSPYMVSNPVHTGLGIIVGIASASIIAYMLYRMGIKLNMRSMFLGTSIMLVLIASGLLGQGIHELIEYAEEEGIELGVIAEKAYDLGFPSGHPLDTKGVVGSVFSVLIGYSDSMEWGRLIIQFGYLIIGLYLILRAYDII